MKLRMEQDKMRKMEKIMLDTNIYGVMAKDEDRTEIVKKIKMIKLIVYGFRTIRKELRDVPKETKVVSNDEKSMLTENAVRAYNLINSVVNKRTPKFINYGEFKRMLRGGDSNELF